MRYRLALLTVLGILGCTDSSNPNAVVTRDPSDVDIITLDSTAPTIATDSVSFYAIVGQKRSVEIYFDSAGIQLDRLLRFEVDKSSLYRKPDGSRFHGGDSILIIVRVTDPATMQFTFEPSGLVFSSHDPAELTIGYGHALDAVVNAAGPLRDHGHGGNHSEVDLSIWRQEQPNSVYYRLDSEVDVDDKEIEAEVPGFSKYAVAY